MSYAIAAIHLRAESNDKIQRKYFHVVSRKTIRETWAEMPMSRVR